MCTQMCTETQSNTHLTSRPRRKSVALLYVSGFVTLDMPRGQEIVCMRCFIYLLPA